MKLEFNDLVIDMPSFKDLEDDLKECSKENNKCRYCKKIIGDRISSICIKCYNTLKKG